MFSQEKYQGIAQSSQQEGNYKVDTKWLDIDRSPAVLKEYDGTQVATVNTQGNLVYTTGIEGETLYIYGWPVCEFTDAEAGTDKEITYVSNGSMEI